MPLTSKPTAGRYERLLAGTKATATVSILVVSVWAMNTGAMSTGAMAQVGAPKVPPGVLIEPPREQAEPKRRPQREPDRRARPEQGQTDPSPDSPGCPAFERELELLV